MMRFLYRIIAALAVFSLLTVSAYAQSSASLRKQELERVSISEIPLAGYDEPKPGDIPGPTEPAYTYWGQIYAIRDVDTVQGMVDLGFNTHMWFGYRFSANDGFEITKKGGRSASHVARGFKCRDLMVGWLGSKQVFPKTAKYHQFNKPIRVVVQSVKSDKYAERWLFVIYKDGVNLNQLAARSGCSIVTTFKSKPPFYPRDTPITANMK